jgi:uncharacterized membrane protein
MRLALHVIVMPEGCPAGRGEMESRSAGPVKPHPRGLTPVVERNINVLLERRREQDATRGVQARLADRITRFAGSMLFAYIHLALFGVWILLSTGWLPLPRFDRTLVGLAMFASVEAIFLSTFVLITQNRMAADADKRAELDLQISLLAEHEITRLVRLVSALAEKSGVQEADDPELDELEQNIAPEKVLDRIETKHGDFARER